MIHLENFDNFNSICESYQNKTFYHGSFEFFDKFSGSEVYYFTEKQWLAEDFGDNIYECHLDIRNPYNFKDTNGYIKDGLTAYEFHDSVYYSEEPASEYYQKKIDGNEPKHTIVDITNCWVIKDDLISEGYDSAINSNDHMEIAVFDKHNITIIKKPEL